MSSKIEWTDETWNPVVGCSVVSPGCTNCYAMKMAARLEAMGGALNHYCGTTVRSSAGPVWTGKVAQAPEHILTRPLGWKQPRRVFVNSMGDLFHESVPDAWIDRVFAVMALCPQHTFQILTKRAARMREYMSGEAARYRIARPIVDLLIAGTVAAGDGWPVVGEGEVDNPDNIKLREWPLPNVWLGVTAEDQRRADERIPDLVETPAAVKFVSCEPLLSSVDLSPWLAIQRITLGGRPHLTEITGRVSALDWVICGGETGPGARPMLPDWARDLRDQCKAADVPFFFKQCGTVAKADPLCFGKHCEGRKLDGVEHNEMPVRRD